MSGGILTFSSASSVSGSLMSSGSLGCLHSMASILASTLCNIPNTSALATGLLLPAPLPTRISISTKQLQTCSNATNDATKLKVSSLSQNPHSFAPRGLLTFPWQFYLSILEKIDK